jgi:hypothetical protein
LAEAGSDGLNAGFFLALLDDFECAFELEACFEEFSEFLGEIQKLGGVKAGEGFVGGGSFFGGIGRAVCAGDPDGLESAFPQEPVGLAARVGGEAAASGRACGVGGFVGKFSHGRN